MKNDCSMCGGQSKADVLEEIHRHVVGLGSTFLMSIGGSGKLCEPGYTPGFSYTVGMWKNFGAPEIMTYAINPGVLNEVRELVRVGLVIEPHKRVPGIAKGYDTVFAEITKVDEIFTFTRLFYDQYGEASDAAFPRMQLVWPDEFNNFPWEETFNQKFEGAQPPLGNWPEKGAKV